MLTDSEVDRRFSMLVADLNLAVQAVEWPVMSEPAENFSDGEPTASTPFVRGPMGALRAGAVFSAAIFTAVGLVLAFTGDVGLGFVVAWFALIVPAATLGTVFVVDRLRRHTLDSDR